jgi:hypothetical protein
MTMVRKIARSRGSFFSLMSSRSPPPCPQLNRGQLNRARYVGGMAPAPMTLA